MKEIRQNCDFQKIGPLVDKNMSSEALVLGNKLIKLLGFH